MQLFFFFFFSKGAGAESHVFKRAALVIHLSEKEHRGKGKFAHLASLNGA